MPSYSSSGVVCFVREMVSGVGVLVLWHSDPTCSTWFQGSNWPTFPQSYFCLVLFLPSYTP